MKKYMLSLFDDTNRLWSTTFLIVSLLLIILSLSMGMKNNLLLNVLFVGGIGFLYLAFLHTWRKVSNYLYLLGTASVIFMLFFCITLIVSVAGPDPELSGPGKIQILMGGLYTVIGLCICIPGIILGLLGSVILGYKKFRSSMEARGRTIH